MACCLIGTKPLYEPMLAFWTLWNKFHRNYNRNSCIFFHSSAICKMMAIYPRSQCVNVSSHPGIPGVTLCFCTGSYTAACAARRLQSFVHMITSEQLCRFLSFLAGLMHLTYRIPGVGCCFLRKLDYYSSEKFTQVDI